jgi:hypothetical protein
MFVPSISAGIIRLADRLVSAWRQRGARRRKARIVRHVEGLPPYLLKDIGLAGTSDVAAAVDRGRAPGERGPDRLCRTAILPHAA